MVQDSKPLVSGNDYEKIIAALRAELSWRWDSRFETALTEIRIEEKDSVGKTLQGYLGTAWDSITIDRAPESVRSVIGRLGGIMPGQLLYAAGLPEDGIVFCAWWPWGNGKTISVRIGTTPENSALLATLVPPDTR